MVAGSRHRRDGDRALHLSLQRFKVGQEIVVRYDPGRPSAAEVDSFAVLWGLALLRTGFGAVFLLMGQIELFLRAG